MGWNPFKISVRNTAGKRKTYRAKLAGLHVKVVGRPSVYTATDVSPTGLGLKGATGMRVGQVFEIGLYHKGLRVVEGINVRVVRVSDAFTGLLFVDMDARQEDAVHDLVLQEMKRQADARNKERSPGSEYYDMNF